MSKEMENKMYLVPPKGYVNELARIAGCTRRTVSSALHHNASGEKADKVRAIYKAKYMK